MIIAYPDSSIKTKFNYPLLKEDGTLLSTSYYSITSMVDEECTWVDKMTIQITVDEENPEPIPYEFNHESGDNVILTIDGKIQFNRIEEIDPTNYKIKLSKIVSLMAPTTLFIKGDYNIYTFDEDCPESYYRMKNNELVIIKNTFQNIYIDFSSLVTRNKRVIGLFKECDMRMYNQEALNSVYADLSYLKDVWNIIDASQFREMVMLKILSIIEQNHYPNETNFRTSYSDYLKVVINVIKVSATTNTTDVKSSMSGGWSWTLGS